MKSAYIFTLVILLSLGVAGCDEPRKTPPNVTVSFLHAAPTQRTIQFRREESTATELNYRESAIGSFGVDTYDFHFDTTPAGDDVLRLHSFRQEFVAGTSYHIIAAELGGQLQEIVLEFPAAAPDTTDTLLAALHLAPTLGAVDLYLEAPGTDPLTSAPFASLSVADNTELQTVTPGDYEAILTVASNPAIVLMRSATFTFGAPTSALFTIVEGGGTGFASSAIVASWGADFTLVDQTLDSRLRVINGISDQSALDIGIDASLMPPLIPGLAFGTVSEYETIVPGSRTVTATPAGNPSVIAVESEYGANAGDFSTLFIANEPGSASTVFSVDDRRAIPGEAKLNIYNAAALFPFVDIFITAPGTDITSLAPSAGLTPGGTIPDLALAAGDHEITIRDVVGNSTLAGPTALTLSDGGYYGIIITDAAGGATVDLVLIDDFI